MKRCVVFRRTLLRSVRLSKAVTNALPNFLGLCASFFLFGSLVLADQLPSDESTTKLNGNTSDESTLALRPTERPSSIRFATFNVSLYRKKEGQLQTDLATGRNRQAHQLAEIIQRVRPDVLLLNEFDYDAKGNAASSFRKLYLEVQHGEVQAIDFPFQFFAESNTGIPSGLDLDQNGKQKDPADCYGYGTYPGQYGMLVLSRFPILQQEVRTFQTFLWKDMPNAKLPFDQAGKSYYNKTALAVFRLSSKSHWDIPIIAGDQKIHFLACHPTPPVFDGPEDRNGKRNHDEIRFFSDYIDAQRSDYIRDDQGRSGGLKAGSRFVIAGDLNADPNDGDSHENAATQLLTHPLIRSKPVPSSLGAIAFAKQLANAQHRGNPAYDTGDFNDRRMGNLRIDYVLPSKTLKVSDAGVFWPPQNSPLSKLLGATDHRLVWIDVTF